MKKAYTLLLFVITAHIALSQEWKEDYELQTHGNTYIVSALSGIRLRAEPSFTGKTLISIPFKDTLTALEENDFPYESRITSPDSITGNWLKVKYRDKEGYCFNAFLTQAIVRMENPYYLIYEEYSCVPNSYISKKYNYYGVFELKGKQYLKKVKPLAISHYDEFPGTDTKADTTARPLFMIATLDTLKQGQILGRLDTTLLNVSEYEHMPTVDRYVLMNEKLVIWPMKCVEYTYIMLNNVEKTRKQAILHHQNFLRAGVYWQGDFNSDGQLDLILYFNTDGHTNWYILCMGDTSNAGFVKWISTFFFHHCC